MRGWAMGVARGLIAFIVARPGLDAFLRRQVYRFPGLSRRARDAVTRSRRPQSDLAPVRIEEADLTEAAHLVLADLARAASHARAR